MNTTKREDAALAALKETGGWDEVGEIVAINDGLGTTFMEFHSGERPTIPGTKLYTRLAAPSKEAGPDFDAMAYRFLAWPLAASVCADPCASMQNYPNRTGTNLLSFVEAKAMLQHVLTTPCPIDGLTESHVGMDPPHQYTANPPGDQRREGEKPARIEQDPDGNWIASPAAAAVGELLDSVIGSARDDQRNGLTFMSPTTALFRKRVLAALASPTEAAKASQRLIHGFMLDCNAIGLLGAAENLHKGLKQAAAALAARDGGSNA